MKRLFKVTTRNTNKKCLIDSQWIVDANEMIQGEVGHGFFFTSKQDAKMYRDYMGEENHKVSKGPDHVGNHGGYGPSRMRRKPR